MSRALVVSTVHPPDDPRLRFKLIPTLSSDWQVTYACRAPGPSSIDGYAYHALRGGRLRRDLGAARLLLGRSYEVASVHDPELLPAVVLAGILRRTVVFDLHENLPEQMRGRPGWPRPLRAVAMVAARALLRVAERVGRVTVAESSYLGLFRGAAPVFPNYLVSMSEEPRSAGDGGGVVYLGDVTEARGAHLTVLAVSESNTGLALDLIGRCHGGLSAKLERLAADRGVELRMHGYLPFDEAIGIVARSVVGLSPLTDVPNYRHSLPTKVLEYLAAGVPVVASDLPGTVDAISGRPGVRLVPPSDIAAWGRAIAEVAETTSLRDETAAAAPALRVEYAWPARAVGEFYAALRR